MHDNWTRTRTAPTKRHPDSSSKRTVLAGPPTPPISAPRRAVDLLVVLLLAPLALFVLAVCAAAIRLESRGPIFFFQERVGRAGRPLRLVKLRTMVADAAALKQDLLDRNSRAWPDFKIANDPRITRVGRLLRRTSLDELPQLWNVLTGEMTLVGPRPCSVGLDRYQLWQTERLEVAPGIFGSWQAGHRSSADFVTRCRLDIGQIRSSSLRADLLISARTIRAVVLLRGAE